LSEAQQASRNKINKQIMLIEEELGSSMRKLSHQDQLDRVIATLNLEKADNVALTALRKDITTNFTSLKVHREQGAALSTVDKRQA
jgi:hypothetical protein